MTAFGLSSNSDWHADFVKRVMPAVERQARITFRRLHQSDREEALQGTLTLAFAAYVDLVNKGKTDRAFPSTLATYAARQVKAGRIVGGHLNSRDALSAAAQAKRRFKVSNIGVVANCAPEIREQLGEHDRASIPDQAAFRIDFPAWLSRLTPRKRRIAQSLAMGERGKDVARRFGLARSRISQVRGELHADWRRFHNEQDLDHLDQRREFANKQTDQSEPVAS